MSARGGAAADPAAYLPSALDHQGAVHVDRERQGVAAEDRPRSKVRQPGSPEGHWPLHRHETRAHPFRYRLRRTGHAGVIGRRSTVPRGAAAFARVLRRGTPRGLPPTAPPAPAKPLAPSHRPSYARPPLPGSYATRRAGTIFPTTRLSPIFRMGLPRQDPDRNPSHIR